MPLTSDSTNKCHTSTTPASVSAAIATAVNSETARVQVVTVRRLKRSASTPPMGGTNTYGSIEANTTAPTEPEWPVM